MQEEKEHEVGKRWPVRCGRRQQSPRPCRLGAATLAIRIDLRGLRAGGPQEGQKGGGKEGRSLSGAAHPLHKLTKSSKLTRPSSTLQEVRISRVISSISSSDSFSPMMDMTCLRSLSGAAHPLHKLT